MNVFFQVRNNDYSNNSFANNQYEQRNNVNRNMRNSNYNSRGGVGGRSNMNERPNRNTFNNRDNGLYFILFIFCSEDHNTKTSFLINYWL